MTIRNRRSKSKRRFRNVLWADQSGRCFYCDAAMDRSGVGTDRSATLDHVVSLNDGGRDVLSNLVLACDACNRAKGQLTLDQLKRMVARIEQFLSNPPSRAGSEPGASGASEMPVYLVSGPDDSEQLVDAPNQASARNHVARGKFAVGVAKAQDIARICKGGGDIVTAGADAIEPAPVHVTENMGSLSSEDMNGGASDPAKAKAK